MHVGMALLLAGTAALVWIAGTLSMLEPSKLQAILALFSLC